MADCCDSSVATLMDDTGHRMKCAKWAKSHRLTNECEFVNGS